MPTRYVAMPPEEAKPRPFEWTLGITPGRGGGNLTFWIREIEMAMSPGLISLEYQ